jgi:predicted acetylornithine/succinylornithine family transaminase
MTTTAASIHDRAAQYLMNNYGDRRLALVRGEGAYVWDSEGKRYVDLLCGLGVTNLGHCHPNVVRAIHKQAETLLHVSNLYLIEPQVELAQLLIENSCADKAFFCNSGTEANEAAIKMARRYSFNKYGEGRHSVVALTNSFHGRTMASLTATGQDKHKTGFQPLLPGFKHVPINDIDAMREACDETISAVIVEPVQGEGGIHPCQSAYIQSLREICSAKDILLIFDEVQCGLGRSGHLFASEELGAEPDMITLAKSMAGGVAIGALLAKSHAAEAFAPGAHAATFGGNPLACAAGVAALQTVIDEKLPQRSHDLGERFMESLQALVAKHSRIKEVRGRGLMIGVELNDSASDIVSYFLEEGYLVGTAGPNVLRFLPPLIIDEQELIRAAAMLDAALSR